MESRCKCKARCGVDAIVCKFTRGNPGKRPYSARKVILNWYSPVSLPLFGPTIDSAGSWKATNFKCGLFLKRGIYLSPKSKHFLRMEPCLSIRGHWNTERCAVVPWNPCETNACHIFQAPEWTINYCTPYSNSPFEEPLHIIAVWRRFDSGT